MTRAFRDGESCIECGTTEKKRHAYGLCVNCYARIWREDNPEKVKAAAKKYENSPKRKLQRKKRQDTPEHKTYMIKKAAEYRARNPELVLERTRKWREENRDHIDAYNEAQKDIRLVKKYGEDALRLKMECGGKCQRCGSDNRVAIHHIDWNQKNNTYENFSILCNVCHSALHSWQPPRYRLEIFEEWMKLK